MPLARPQRALPATLLIALASTATAHAGPPKVPDGFECRLVASVPAVEYPCQVATGPDGALFVAEDPMDQVGPYEARHGRILLFRDGQDPIVFADGFRAIFGMAWREGALFVSHMPYLTVLRDNDGDGKADERKDIFKDLGPTDNHGLNDHIVSGIQFGIDGYLYISVGDKGIPKATGPDGRTIQLKGGGIVRCRPDGSGLEVYSSGTRNHLEPNLDERDNLFTYDNTDDGDGWWTRVTHHIDGGYYGYAYDYHDHPDRFLPRMAEYGGGSPCGALFYREDAWPEKYRGVGFWAEWGKHKVHAFRFEPDGSTYKVAEAIDFATPEPGDTFVPIDLALSFDGRTLYVADWNMGGWGNKDEKVGRVFAITYKGDIQTRPRGQDSDDLMAQFKQLDHPSYNERMRAQRAIIRKVRAEVSQEEGREEGSLAVVRRLNGAPMQGEGLSPVALRHLIWIVDDLMGGSPEGTKILIDYLRHPVPDLRAQAARALGERRVPRAHDSLTKLLMDPEPSVRLQAVIALGRIGEPAIVPELLGLELTRKAKAVMPIGDVVAVPELLAILADPDVYLAFSARQALRRINAWDAVADGLNSENEKVRAGVLGAMEGIYDLDAATHLAAFARNHHAAAERARALLVLAEVHRKAKPWDGHWWGTRPTQGKPPAKVDPWEGTDLVLGTIRQLLDDADGPVRLAAVAAVRATGDRDSLPALRKRFESEPEVNIRSEIARTFGVLEDKDALPLLVGSLRAPDVPDSVREAALAAVEAIGTEIATHALIELLDRDDLPAERQPRLIAALGKFKATEAIKPLLEKLKSPAPAVRASTAEALGKIGRVEGVVEEVRPLLDDPDLGVRKAAIAASAALRDREAVPGLMKAAETDQTRFEAMMALADVSDVKALQVYLRGLADKNQELRQASARALGSIRDEAAPVLDKLAERHELPASVIPELRRVFEMVRPLDRWRLLGPFALDAPMPFDPTGPIDLGANHTGRGGKPVTWRLVRRVGEHGAINLERFYRSGDRLLAFGYTEFESPKARKAEFVVGSDDTLTVWVNGAKVYDFQDDRGFEAEQGRFEADLQGGTNRILIRCGNHGGPWIFAVAVPAAVDYAFLKGSAGAGFDPEMYRAFALKEKGDPERGRALFGDLKGLACIKCHAVKGQGGNVGPDLAGIGTRYNRADLIESVLFPSAKIFSGYEPVVVATTDGRVLTGIIKSDGDNLEIQDAEGKRIAVAKDQIDERRASDVSLMPSGLAEGLSTRDFADVIGYLESLTEPVPAASAPKPTAGR